MVAATQIATMDRTFPMSHPTKKIPSLHIGQIMDRMIVIVTSKTTTRKVEIDRELSMVESRNRVRLENEIEMIEIRKSSLKIKDRKIERMIMGHVVKEGPMRRTNLEI